MARNRNTDTSGKAFGRNVVAEVWKKGRSIEGYDPNIWRYDLCGKPVKYSEYGNTGSKHGWEVDHIKPISKGGTDSLSNLQPLQWENNRDKSDMYPWTC